jgi:hypothetical protein
MLLRRWLVVSLSVCLVFLSGCSLPQVSAEERLFLNLSLDFLGEYELPKQEFQQTPVGGLSAITYDRQRDRFYAVSDDRSDLAPARFYTLKVDLDRSNDTAPWIGQVALEAVTFLTDEKGQPYAKGTVDTEGIALSPGGGVFVSSEGVTRDRLPPLVRQFDRVSGKGQSSLPIPSRYLPNPKGEELTQGVQDNLGFEALTLVAGSYGQGSGTSTEPFRIFTATESALIQDQGAPGQESLSRMLHYLVESGRFLLVSEHAYPVDPVPRGALSNGLAEILAVDQAGHFLSLERSFGPLVGFGVKLYQITTSGATDTSTIDSLKGPLRGVQPIRKKLLLDLSELGIRLDNLEGMTLGPRLPDGSQSLLLVSDDNFQPAQVTQFLLFRLKGLRPGR